MLSSDPYGWEKPLLSEVSGRIGGEKAKTFFLFHDIWKVIVEEKPFIKHLRLFLGVSWVEQTPNSSCLDKKKQTWPKKDNKSLSVKADRDTFMTSFLLTIFISIKKFIGLLLRYTETVDNKKCFLLWTVVITAGCKSASCLGGQWWPTMHGGLSYFYVRRSFLGVPPLTEKNRAIIMK